MIPLRPPIVRPSESLVFFWSTMTVSEKSTAHSVHTKIWTALKSAGLCLRTHL